MNEPSQPVTGRVNPSRGVFEALSAEAVSNAVIRNRSDRSAAREIEMRWRQSTEAHLGLYKDINAQNLAEAGWGVIMAAEANSRILSALRPLIDLRRSQARERYREYVGPTGFLPGDDHRRFLARQGVSFGPVDPRRVPYFLMIVGSPTDIPYEFQQMLALQYAVGRIYFDDVEAYARYARSVVEVESGTVALPRKARFFAPSFPGDRASANAVAQIESAMHVEPPTPLEDWQYEASTGYLATKASLQRMLGGDLTPAVLVVASHGLVFDPSDKREKLSGAILCAGWQGPATSDGSPIPPDEYFSAHEVPWDAGLLGSIFVLLSGNSAGTMPTVLDQPEATEQKTPVWPAVAQLPQRLLGHERGGALAVIGQLTSETIVSQGLPGEQFAADNLVRDLVVQLLTGRPVGLALDAASLRYAAMAVSLNSELEDIKFGKRFDKNTLATMALATSAAQGLVLLGDPAVGLVTLSSTAAAVRPSLSQPSSPPATPAEADQARPDPLDAAILEIAKGPLRVLSQRATPPFRAEPEEENGERAPSPKAEPGAEQASSAPAEAPPGQTQVGPPAPEGDIAYDDLTISPFTGSSAQSVRQQRVIEQLSETLLALLQGATVTQVETHVAAQILPASTDDNAPAGARRLASTKLVLDGDTTLLVSAEPSAADRELLQLHQETVRIVSSERTRLIEALARALTGLTDERL